MVIKIVHSYYATEGCLFNRIITFSFTYMNCLPSSNKNSAAAQARPCSTARVSGVICSSSRQSGEAP